MRYCVPPNKRNFMLPKNRQNAIKLGISLENTQSCILLIEQEFLVLEQQRSHEHNILSQKNSTFLDRQIKFVMHNTTYILTMPQLSRIYLGDSDNLSPHAYRMPFIFHKIKEARERKCVVMFPVLQYQTYLSLLQWF